MNEVKRDAIQEALTAVSEGLAKVEEAAKFLSIGRSKLYGEMDAGRLVYCKIGRARRIPWKVLREYAADSLMLAS